MLLAVFKPQPFLFSVLAGLVTLAAWELILKPRLVPDAAPPAPDEPGLFDFFTGS